LKVLSVEIRPALKAGDSSFSLFFHWAAAGPRGRPATIKKKRQKEERNDALSKGYPIMITCPLERASILL